MRPSQKARGGGGGRVCFFSASFFDRVLCFVSYFSLSFFGHYTSHQKELTAKSPVVLLSVSAGRLTGAPRKKGRNSRPEHTHCKLAQKLMLQLRGEMWGARHFGNSKSRHKPNLKWLPFDGSSKLCGMGNHVGTPPEGKFEDVTVEDPNAWVCTGAQWSCQQGKQSPKTHLHPNLTEKKDDWTVVQRTNVKANIYLGTSLCLGVGKGGPRSRKLKISYSGHPISWLTSDTF